MYTEIEEVGMKEAKRRTYLPCLENANSLKELAKVRQSKSHKWRCNIMLNPGVGGGGGHSLIWAKRGRATGEGMVFWPCCPEQGIQFDLPLP